MKSTKPGTYRFYREDNRFVFVDAEANTPGSAFISVCFASSYVIFVGVLFFLMVLLRINHTGEHSAINESVIPVMALLLILLVGVPIKALFSSSASLFKGFRPFLYFLVFSLSLLCIARYSFAQGLSLLGFFALLVLVLYSIHAYKRLFYLIGIAAIAAAISYVSFMLYGDLYLLMGAVYIAIIVSAFAAVMGAYRRVLAASSPVVTAGSLEGYTTFIYR